MENIYNHIKELEACRTAKQVLKLLDKLNIPYKQGYYQVHTNKDLSVWLDDETRIYNSPFGYTVQRWKRTKKILTGNKKEIPICYGLTEWIDEYIEVEIEYNGIHKKD